MFAALKRAWRQYQESLAIDRDDHHGEHHDGAHEPGPLDGLPAATLNAFAELGALLVAHLPPSDAEALRMQLQAQLEEDADAPEALAQWFGDQVDPQGPPLGFIALDWKAREEVGWQIAALARAHGVAPDFAYDVEGDTHWQGWQQRQEAPVDTPLRLAAAALAPLGLTLVRFSVDDAVFAFAVRAEEGAQAAALCRTLGLETWHGGR